MFKVKKNKAKGAPAAKAPWSKKKKGLLLGGLVGGLLLVLVAVNFINARGDRGIEVTVSPVQPGTMELSLLADGKIDALNTQSFYTTGGAKLEKLSVRIGDQVKAGQSMGQLEKLQLRADYLQAQSALADAESLVAEYRIKATDAPERAKIAVAKAEQAWSKPGSTLMSDCRALRPRSLPMPSVSCFRLKIAWRSCALATIRQR